MELEQKRAYDRAYHANRTPEAKARKIALQRERALKTLTAIRQYKASCGCKDCGECDPIVLEFDHLEQKQKSFTIGEVARNGWSLDKIMQEIAKCDVVCANCHRRRTAKSYWRKE